MTQRVRGSVKNKIVASELAEERDKLDFNKEEIYHIFESDPTTRYVFEKSKNDLENDPKLQLSEKYYEMTPQEKYFMWFKKLNHLWNHHDRDFYFGPMQSNRYY